MDEEMKDKTEAAEAEAVNTETVSAVEADAVKAGRKKPKKSIGREILEWVVTILAALAIAFVIRTFIFEPVRVDGASMNDTLQDGEVMIVTKFKYATAYIPLIGSFPIGGSPERFDVIICRYPGRGSTNFVKRVIGLPGDKVQLINGYLYVNGEKYDEVYVNDEYRTGWLNNFSEYTVPEGQYFVMGDHRNNSNDSRSVGTISRDMIVGKVVQVVYPFSNFRSIPNGLKVEASK